jgi:uncharacterized protein (TIGR02145 family)
MKPTGLFLAVLLCSHLSAQLTGTRLSAQQAGIERIPVNKSFAANERFNPFTSSHAVSGLTIGGDIVLNSDTSLVRVILTDKLGHEYLVYETYPLISGSGHFSIDNTGEESLVLNGIVPASIRFELTDASIFLKELITIPGKVTQLYRAKQAADRTAKIDEINRHIHERGGLWLAGETSVSRLTFEEKKMLFGGKIPNLQGFEYYCGGIFVVPEPAAGKIVHEPKSASQYVEEFTWRNRHGQDWTTAVRNQGNCNSCWAFAATGATEMLINLFYNRHLNYDLSEQQLVSCIPGNCSGGSTKEGLSFIRLNGVVKESCFPYVAMDVNCNKKCDSPGEMIKISEYKWFDPNYDELRSLLIRGPVSLSIASWNHAVTLVGYKKIKEGDRLYRKADTKDVWYTVPAGDPLIGKTMWQIKNSWGTAFGESGFANIVLSMNNIINTFCVDGTISSQVYKSRDIQCLDLDGDGYYNWGTGPKPAHCPPSPDLPDGDDSNPCLGPMDEYGYLAPAIPLPPVAGDVVAGPGQPVPYLHATGNNIRWYADSALTVPVYTGNDFNTGQTAGVFTYYATQNPGSCESKPRKITLKIEIPPPLTEDVQVCEGTLPILTASGEKIRWYTDSSLFILDGRDGQYYKTTIIGNQKWLAENVNYAMQGSAYYQHDSLHYHEYGRLYTWESALNACPSGWSLPTDRQWMDLEKELGMSDQEAGQEGHFRGTAEGDKLKEAGTTHWYTNESASNEVGFKLLPGGEGRDVLRDFSNSGERAYLWSGTYTGRAPYAYARVVSYDSSGILRASYPNATGMSVRCIRTGSDMKQIASGNNYPVTDTIPGIYDFFVSQEVAGLESVRKKVEVRVRSRTYLPLPGKIEICSGTPFPGLTQEGELIKWYADPELTTLIHTGNSYIPGDSLPGTYTCYATKETVCGESQGNELVLIINPLPSLNLGRDTTLTLQEIVTFDVDKQFTSYLWNNGSTSPYREIQGIDLRLGRHNIWLHVTDSNNCGYTDTLQLTVVTATGVQVFPGEKNILISPNPGSGAFTFSFVNHEGDRVTIMVMDQHGRELFSKKVLIPTNNERVPMDLTGLPNGIYIVRVASGKLLHFDKIVKAD